MTQSEMNKLRRALHDSDNYVLRMTYCDRSGCVTERVVSPIRFVDSKTMLALCLCRENPRRFDLDRCSDFDLIEAHEVLMPVPIKTRMATA